jgi:hypothetical protein
VWVTCHAICDFADLVATWTARADLPERRARLAMAIAAASTLVGVAAAAGLGVSSDSERFGRRLGLGRPPRQLANARTDVEGNGATAAEGTAGSNDPAKGGSMATEETGDVTGTKDKDYNLIWFVEQSLSNALRLETYIQDAERDGDSELADFFRRAQGASRKGGEQGKDLLRQRVAR